LNLELENGGQMREILTGIFSWPWFSEPHGYNFNGHFILHAGGNLCVDPVEPTDADLEELGRRGVAHILITNRNHSRAANKVRARTGARTAIHSADAPHAKSEGAELDGKLKLGQRVGPFVVLGAPGKSAGEVVLHWPERKILLVGDAVVGHPPGRCKLLPDKVVDDPPRLRDSVRGLLSIDFDTLLVGDGEPILQSAKERLRELVATFPE
jgi:glyoxylase-like metal-dependent hydrolase (beta-lactamase superfamily II)